MLTGARSKGECAYQVKPALVDMVAGLVFGHDVVPFAAFRATRILPFGLNSLLEEVEVRPVRQPARLQYVVVQAARHRKKKGKRGRS